MKSDIHPNYKMVTFKCACGAAYTAGSTIKDSEFKTEICSNCHPFYTGKQKLIDSSGRVDKFIAKMKKAQEFAEQNVKTVKKGKEKIIAKVTAEAAKKKEAEKPKKEVKNAPKNLSETE